MSRSTVKLNGKLAIERDVPFLTPDQIRAQLETLAGPGRRIVIVRGSEARPLDQFPRDFNMGSEVRAKDFPASTQKGCRRAQ